VTPDPDSFDLTPELTDSQNTAGILAGLDLRESQREAAQTLLAHADWVIDFRDSLPLLREQPTPASAVLAGEHWRPYRPATRHSEPVDAPRFEELALPGIGRLPIALGQTFGVEIELTARDGVPPVGRPWEEPARAIIARLKETAGAPVHPAPLGYHGSADLTRWRVTHDASCGWEVVSPILVDGDGVEELRRVCDGLTALVQQRDDLRVSHRTGLHLTLAARLNTDERLRGFVSRVQRLEPGLFTLTSPSRLFQFVEGAGYAPGEGNGYCKPLRQARDADSIGPAGLDRCHSVNLTRAYDGIQTLEIRMHGGTTEFRKVVLWLSLWMQVFNRSRYSWQGGGRRGSVFPGGDRSIDRGQVDQEDIIRLLDAEGIALTPVFAGLLRRRRLELREWWGKVLPSRVAAWERAGWYRGVG
jgi:hypothetical protein